MIKGGHGQTNQLIYDINWGTFNHASCDYYLIFNLLYMYTWSQLQGSSHTFSTGIHVHVGIRTCVCVVILQCVHVTLNANTFELVN